MNPIAFSVTAAQEAEAAAPKPPERLVSLDAYRGLAMLLMASGLLALPEVAAHFPDSRFWQALGFHWEHVAWNGCSLHDLIQPSFTFMVGVALPFSLAGRVARGQSMVQQWIHVLWRSLLLVLLGVALRSIGRPMTYWTFEDTLSQIGLGYPILFAIAAWGWRAPWIALGVVLVGYWTAFAVYPLPPAGFDWQAVDGKAWYAGFQGHWNQNGNAAWAFDRWFLNLLPRETPFTGNDGGYSTLSFIPTLGTMLLGLIAGRWLLDAPPEEGAEFHESQPLRIAGKLILTGLLLLLAGWVLDRLGWCPSVKKIWTPAWTLFSGGWCFLIMAGFYLVADVWRVRRIFFPLTVVGMNSIAMYVLVESLSGFTRESLLTHLGPKPFLIAGDPYASVLQGIGVILIFWLILRWMYGRRLFLKI